MTPCERTALYYDGQLSPAEEEQALDHLATCAACQAELGDLVGLDAALSRGPRQAAAPPAPSRWPRVVGAAVLAVAVAAAALLLLRRDDDAPQIALGETRAIEGRFSSSPFDRHRPYRVSRGGGAGADALPLATLAALERSGDRAALAAAHALSGNLSRAAAEARAMPADARRESDLAVIALAAGSVDDALTHADAALALAPDLAAARWNRALALQALDLPLAAAAELDAVAALREPGWAAEAAARAAALRQPVRDRRADQDAFSAAGRAMVAGTGPVLDAAAVRRHPGPARDFFDDALRVASTPDQLRALAPVAAALDAVAGDDHAASALARAQGQGDRAARGRFQDRYRALVAGVVDESARAALLADLIRTGGVVDDLAIGAILAGGARAAELPRLRALIAASGDPGLALRLELEEARAQRAGGDTAGAERRLAQASASCPRRTWPQRCGDVDAELAAVLDQRGAGDLAIQRMAAARAAYVAAGAFDRETDALARAGELARTQGRQAMARAYRDELRLRGR